MIFMTYTIRLIMVSTGDTVRVRLDRGSVISSALAWTSVPHYGHYSYKQDQLEWSVVSYSQNINLHIPPFLVLLCLMLLNVSSVADGLLVESTCCKFHFYANSDVYFTTV